jgi:hypothetical protein
MRLLTKWAAILLISTGTVSIGFAQENAAATADRTTSKASSKTAASSEKGAAAPSEVPVEEGTEAETAEPEPIETLIENTLDMCQDGQDNDADSHVDCDDQDCEIFAMCVQPEAGREEPESPSTPPTHVRIPVRFPVVEDGLQCRDGIDNDDNGKIDCHDPACQMSYYCKRIMYERPEPPNKIPGLFINGAMGVALPNYRLPTGETEWQDPNTGEIYDVPFDPDMGVMMDLQVGYLFMKWLGAGVGFKSAFTYATNRELYFLSKDDSDKYKYVGSKYYGNISGFVRVQWPTARIVPHLSLHVGYSVSQYTWHVYDSYNSWSDIDSYEIDDSEYILGDMDEIRSQRQRHFTFAVEPGVDFFPVKRLFGIGIKAWLPVVASNNPEADNLGVLLNLTFTPMWREPLQLKPEYAQKP